MAEKSDGATRGHAVAVCDYCKRTAELLKVGEEWRFVTHPTRNGRQCYNAYGKPKGEITVRYSKV